MLVVFGRPGAGKSTVAESMLAQAGAGGEQLLGLDLDACVPQWMRDNFAKGVYPTLSERAVFAEEACDYVEAQIKSSSSSSSSSTKTCVVSFSFVNDDLRDAFRARFPDAVWCLVDTSPATAGGRVARRQGHFYTEPPSSSSSSSSSSEWEFDAVAFPHHVLDGEAPASANARDALAFLLGGAAPATTTTEGAGAASVVMGPSVPLEGEAKLKATGFKPKYKV